MMEDIREEIHKAILEWYELCDIRSKYSLGDYIAKQLYEHNWRQVAPEQLPVIYISPNSYYLVARGQRRSMLAKLGVKE